MQWYGFSLSQMKKNERDRRKKNVQLKNENKQNRVDRATTVHTLHTEYASVNRI